MGAQAEEGPSLANRKARLSRAPLPKGLVVQSWEAQSLARSAAAKAAPQARSVPRGMDPALRPRSAAPGAPHAAA